MTEPIDKWKEEFIADDHLKEFRDLSYSYLSGGEIMFNDHTVDLRWEGFLMSKRSQPVVELPKPFHDSVSGYECDELHESLTAAGIPYKIKGE